MIARESKSRKRANTVRIDAILASICALVKTDGETVGRVGPTGYRAYGEDERAALRRAIASAANLGNRAERPAPLAEAEALVTRAHAEAVEAFLTANGMPACDIAVVGF